MENDFVLLNGCIVVRSLSLAGLLSSSFFMISSELSMLLKQRLFSFTII